MIERRMNGDILEVFADGVLVMSLSEKIKENEMLIEITGELRNDIAHEFEDELMAAFSVCRNIRLDLSGATYIASLSMRTLLSVQHLVDEKEDSSLVISGLSDEIREIFSDAGFFDILTFDL